MGNSVYSALVWASFTYLCGLERAAVNPEHALEFIKMAEIFKHKAVSHVLIWLGIFVFTSLRFTLHDDPFPLSEAFIYNIPYTIPQIIMAYLLLYVLIPKLYFHKRYAWFAISFLVALYVLAFTARVLMVHVAEALVRPAPFDQESIYVIATDLYSIFGRYGISVLYMAGLFLAFTYLGAYHREREKALLLAAQKSQAELKSLKAQVHPHFLFNTLNNIYALSVTQSPKAPEAIAKLSELLDYTLYRCNADLVPVSTEIELANNFIELEKLRYTNDLNITQRIKVQHDVLVPPLLLLSLLENAFKHGPGESLQPPAIELDLTCDQQRLDLKLANTFQPKGNKPHTNDGSIGLNNIRQQLELLFPNRHSLDIQTEGNWYAIHLTIQYDL